MPTIARLLAQELNIDPVQIKATIRLLDEGNTVPFIARYRKEATGGLKDEQLRHLADRLAYIRNLHQRKEEVSRLLAERDNLTPEISSQLQKAVSLQEVDDIYRPFRPKRRTRATIARQQGLEPLAEKVLAQAAPLTPACLAAFVNPDAGIDDGQAALAGALDIIAEIISDDAVIRKKVRDLTTKKGLISSRETDNPSAIYAMYSNYSEPVNQIVPHRILALNRGEKEKALTVKIEAPEDKIMNVIESSYLKPGSPTAPLVSQAAQDAYKRLIAPALEREIRNWLTDKAEAQALAVFGRNLKSLLLSPPLKDKVVMGFDPAYRTGCKIAVVDPSGDLLESAVCFPTPPQNKIKEAQEQVLRLIQRHRVDVIALGNGTASRESEQFLAAVIKKSDRPLSYAIVSEAGASVYSASKLGQEEFPDLDVSIRGAISIARRLQDPLAELVKIDPKSLGVGQYQHDVNQKKLEEKLAGVVEDCVNSVGIDLNTASPALLVHVSGISTTVATNIVQYRHDNQGFKDRAELLAVPRLGPKTFEQCAGFLRVRGGANILDQTAVHPDNYQEATKIINLYPLSDLKAKVFSTPEINDLARRLNIGVPTLKDIIHELKKPGRDPREELPPALLRADLLDLKDLRPGMILWGTVRNITDFGAFIDIGLHDDGLAHISELSPHFVHSPFDVVKVGDQVKVRILAVEPERNRISLSLKDV